MIQMELFEQATITHELPNRTAAMITIVSPVLKTTSIKLGYVINT